MKLESVLALKHELLGQSDTLLEHVASATSFRAFSRKRKAAAQALDNIALGVTARARGQHRLAVRPQRQGPHVEAAVAQIREIAKKEVEVEFIGTIVKLAPTTRDSNFYQKTLRPLRIGASISDIKSGVILAGTLGGFVTVRKSGALAILSNNHVLANENRGSLGDPIVQPGTLDGGKEATDVVATLTRFLRLKTTGANVLDAAYAMISTGIDADRTTLGTLGQLAGVGEAASLPANAVVHKIGRTTGQTDGRFRAFDIDNVRITYDIGTLRFDGQIEFEGQGTNAFSHPGDSGSFIVDDNLKVIALLFAGGSQGGTNGKGLTYGNPIAAVLDALQLDLAL